MKLCLSCGLRYLIGWRCRKCGDELQETHKPENVRLDLEHEIAAAAKTLPSDFDLLLRVNADTIDVCLCNRGSYEPLAYRTIASDALADGVGAAVRMLVDLARRHEHTRAG